MNIRDLNGEVRPLDQYPGGDLVAKGISDLRQQICSEEALLVSIARPRLLRLGLSIPELVGTKPPFEHALYEAVEKRMVEGAHGAYTALIGRIVSFANTYRP